jgi:hypothetical protein
MAEPAGRAVQSLTPLKDSLDAIERRVTIYVGGLVWDRHQATWVRVFRAPDAQYADAFHVELKPRRKRLTRRYVEGYKPTTIIVSGWDHPHVRPKILLGPDETTLAPSSNTETVYRGGSNPMDVIIDAYVRSLPIADILLDLRGHVVAADRWSRQPSAPPA